MSEAALLQAIIDSPDDESLRLVYADWVEEHGDVERATFIRVQIDLARRPSDDTAFRLKDTEKRLLAMYRRVWCGPLIGVVNDWEYGRGFVEGITKGGSAFFPIADYILSLAPIRRIHLNGWLPNGFASHPALQRLSTIDLRLVVVGNEGAEGLVTSKMLCPTVRLLLNDAHVSEEWRRRLVERFSDRVQFETHMPQR